jgi:hypothetical protein
MHAFKKNLNNCVPLGSGQYLKRAHKEFIIRFFIVSFFDFAKVFQEKLSITQFLQI